MKTKKYKNINRERDPEEEEAAETEGTDDEVIVLRDPLELFGLDIMLNILSNLDARSGVLSLLVCHAWNGVASSDRLWSSKQHCESCGGVKGGEDSVTVGAFTADAVEGIHLRRCNLRNTMDAAATAIMCEELWLGKAHMPRLLQVRGLSRLAAYSLSIVDGKRSRITRDNLCDHVWEFHFNEAAPKYWRRLDPNWNGAGSLMRRYFHPDGSQTADHGDQVWGGHECCYCTVTSLLENGKIREHYVRINRWPRMFVSRKKDWSWEMSSHLFCYSSIPDSDKAGGTGPLFPVR